MTDEELAGRLAEGAGRLLMELRRSRFLEGAALGIVADKVANAFILTTLREWRPQDPILSEESPDTAERLASERVWIIDPLDGTREFSEPPRGDWAVHVALVIGGHPVAGAVALPAQHVTLMTAPPPPMPPDPPAQPRVIVSRSRPPAIASTLAAELGAALVEMGSAGAKVAAVIMGAADVYAHGGGQYEWDSAAPVAVALAAGLHASRLDGSPLVYNNANPYLPDLLVCHPSLAEAALKVTREAD
jgi:3'(2'), 5'-bisphosphate nucleotidase